MSSLSSPLCVKWRECYEVGSCISEKMSGVSFVSETELDEIRERRQQEWEKVRKEDDPLGKLNYFVSY